MIRKLLLFLLLSICGWSVAFAGPLDTPVIARNGSQMYPLIAKLGEESEDAAVFVNGDSTSAPGSTERWARKFCDALAAKYPRWTVIYYAWQVGGGSYTNATLQTGTNGRTLRFYNASVAGQQAVLNYGSLFEAAFAPATADLFILNHGHNHSNIGNIDTHATEYIALIDTFRLRQPKAGVIIVAQNPLRDSTDGDIRSKGAREAAYMTGAGLLDVYGLFMRRGKAAELYADDVHPSLPVGDDLIFGELWKQTQGTLIPRPMAPPTLGQFSPNLLINGTFAAFGGAVPDGWTLQNATSAQDTTNFETGSWGVKITSTGVGTGQAGAQINQTIDARRFRGKWVTLSARFILDSAINESTIGSIGLATNGGPSRRPFPAGTTGKNGWRWVATTTFVETNANTITASLYACNVATAGLYCTFDRAILVEGRMPFDALP